MRPKPRARNSRSSSVISTSSPRAASVCRWRHPRVRQRCAMPHIRVARLTGRGRPSRREEESLAQRPQRDRPLRRTLARRVFPQARRRARDRDLRHGDRPCRAHGADGGDGARRRQPDAGRRHAWAQPQHVARQAHQVQDPLVAANARVTRALLSVSDKRGVVEFARSLAARGVALLSTGGTAGALAAAGLAVVDIGTYTGFPEMLDGRVKTLHPKVHAGILARRDLDAHMQMLDAHAIPPIDLVVVDPGDYAAIADELARNDGALADATRFRLAQKAFAHTSAYDGAISNWLSARGVDGHAQAFAQSFRYAGEKLQDLRYGENPHQAAAFYRDEAPAASSIASFRQLQGKALSYNNIADSDAAWECVKTFDAPACVIVKHANPCGVALAETTLEAYRRALATDPTSAFGGIIAFNRAVDAATLEAVSAQFVEVVIAPGYTADALGVIAQKKNVRVLEIALPVAAALPQRDMKRVGGGLLLQEADARNVTAAEFTTVSVRQPSAAVTL